MTPAARLILFRRLAFFGVLLALLVVVLGAWVRLNAAGLGCPDWPGCYGHLTVEGAVNNPSDVANHASQRPLEYAKAIKEMVHRYFASSLGLLCVVLAVMAVINRRHPLQNVALPVFLVVLIILQGLLGMWTVTLLLKPLIVTLHLLGGMATLSLLAWLSIKPSPAAHNGNTHNGSTTLKRLALASLLLVVLQIALGGWTSSNYAALACPDFPTCQNSYWPDMDAKDAFVLWRGLGIDYEGGVLTHPARVAIHFVHRLGAVLTTLLLGFTAYRAWRTQRSASIRVAGVLVGVALLAQIILGPVMVMRALPLDLATAHNAVAALLLLAVVRLYRKLH